MRGSASKFRTDSGAQDEEVPMAPLIDCVFLLIIFFLVTSMFKRWESIIPVILPDPSAAVSETAEEQTVLFGVDRDGNVYKGERRLVVDDPRTVYAPIEDLTAYLVGIGKEKGIAADLSFTFEPDTPVQVVIDTLDLAQLQGFVRISAQIRERPILPRR